jgi:hypothetical protein
VKVAPGVRLVRWIESAGSVIPFAFLIYILLNGCVVALLAVVPFQGYPIDGPFQIFDPLRRIAAGQVAGVDFQFYHGILLPFIHYPLFALLGKTIFASEISRQLVSLCAFVASLYLLCFAYTRKLQTAATLSTLTLLLVFMTGAYHLIFPAGSLTGLRGAIPLIFFAVLLTNLEPIRAAGALGLVAAVALATSTENGLAVILAFVLSAMLFAARQGEFTRSWRPAVVFLTSLGVGLVSALGLVSHFRGILSILRYNFIAVPADQYWFFGSAPQIAPASLADLFIHPWFSVPLVVTFILFLAALIATSRLPAKSMAELAPAGVTMTLYALLTFLPYLGHYNAEYSYSAIRIDSIFAVLVAARFSPPWIARFRSKGPAHACLAHIALALPVFWFVAVQPNDLGIAMLKTRIALLKAGHWQPALSPYWQTYLQRADTLIPDPAGKTIWAEYSGLLHDHFGTFNPSTDYIIHVLGPRAREDYLRQFRQVRPDYVETLRVSPYYWEEWLHNSFWDFYQELALNYTRKGVTEHSVIWERRPSGIAALRLVGVVAEGHLKGPLTIPLPPDLRREELLVVELEYETRNPWRWLPLIGHSPRFVVHWEGVSGPVWTPSVALPEYRSSVRFPLVPHLGENPRLRFSVDSVLPGPAIDVRRVSLSVLSLAPADFYELAGDASSGELRTFSLTDANWTNGVWVNFHARNQAGFFVLETPVRTETLARAKTLVFNKSGRRTIQSVERVGPYLNVFVDGPPLSPSGDGFPHRITPE